MGSNPAQGNYSFRQKLTSVEFPVTLSLSLSLSLSLYIYVFLDENGCVCFVLFVCVFFKAGNQPICPDINLLSFASI